MLCVDLLPKLLNCLHVAADHFCVLQRLSLKTSWLLLGAFESPRAIFYETVPSRSLHRLKSALLKSRLVILLFVLLTPLRNLNSTT